MKSANLCLNKKNRITEKAKEELLRETRIALVQENFDLTLYEQYRLLSYFYCW